MFHISIQNRSGRHYCVFKQIGLLFFMCYVNEWTITPKIDIQQNAFGPFLKGLQNIFQMSLF